jgi:hypothetical protein
MPPRKVGLDLNIATSSKVSQNQIVAGLQLDKESRLPYKDLGEFTVINMEDPKPIPRDPYKKLELDSMILPQVAHHCALRVVLQVPVNLPRFIGLHDEDHLCTLRGLRNI